MSHPHPRLGARETSPLHANGKTRGGPSEGALLSLSDSPFWKCEESLVLRFIKPPAILVNFLFPALHDVQVYGTKHFPLADKWHRAVISYL